MCIWRMFVFSLILTSDMAASGQKQSLIRLLCACRAGSNTTESDHKVSSSKSIVSSIC